MAARERARKSGLRGIQNLKSDTPVIYSQPGHVLAVCLQASHFTASASISSWEKMGLKCPPKRIVGNLIDNSLAERKICQWCNISFQSECSQSLVFYIVMYWYGLKACLFFCHIKSKESYTLIISNDFGLLHYLMPHLIAYILCREFVKL